MKMLKVRRRPDAAWGRRWGLKKYHIWLLLLLVSILLLSLQWVLDQGTAEHHVARRLVKKHVMHDDVKTVLLWTPMYRMQQWWHQGMGSFSGCRESLCTVTTDRSSFPYSSAVLFHTLDLKKPGAADLPTFKPPGQRWVFRALESPVHIYLGHQNYTDLRLLDGVFDLTMTYKRNADIQDAYGWYQVKRAKYDDLAKNHVKKRTRFALWYVTNCNLSYTGGLRFQLVRKLQKYMPVDIYGPCGMSDPCETVRSDVPKWWQCTQQMKRKYKFYLAFENSRCTDYITEKLWWALHQGVLPVVVGPKIQNYKELVPPNSFIHTDQFDNMLDLANYLRRLDKNDTAYLEYFKWREKYEVMIGPREPPWCRLCEELHSKAIIREKPYKISEYFSKQTDCMEGYHSSGLRDG